MKTFKEFLEETRRSLTEMSLYKDEAESKIGCLSTEYIDHITKVIVDPHNLAAKHWLREITGWSKSIARIKLKTNNKPPKKGDIKKWLFYTVDTESVFRSDVNDFIKEYKLNNIKYNDNMWKQYLDIREELCEQMSRGSAESSDIYRIFEKCLNVRLRD